jgi:hypothetical protein
VLLIDILDLLLLFTFIKKGFGLMGGASFLEEFGFNYKTLIRGFKLLYYPDILTDFVFLLRVFLVSLDVITYISLELSSGKLVYTFSPPSTGSFFIFSGPLTFL